MIWANAVVQGVLLGGIFAIAAIGLSLMFGVMRVANLAHGDLMILGGFLASLSAQYLHLPAALTILVAVIALGAVGFLVQRGLLDRAIRLNEFAPLMVTFGISIIIPNVLLQLFTSNTQPLQIGALGTASANVGGGVSIGLFPAVTLVVAVALIVGLQLFLSRTQSGRIVRATADDSRVVALLGINARTVFALTTVVAFATVGLAGALYAMRQGGVTPFEGQLVVLFAFETVIIGGLGSMWGTLIGGVVLGVAQSIGAQISPDLPLLVGHLVFLAILAFRPQGILGRRVPA